MSGPAQAAVPSSGFSIAAVFARELRYELVAVDDREGLEEAEDDQDRPITVFWDWRVVSEERAFETVFGVELQPTKQFYERIRATYVGRFQLTDEETPALDVRDFAKANAIAFLIPYVREAISSLAGRGPFGPYILHPVNAAQLARSIPEKKTTAGDQYRSEPDLAEIFGPMEERETPKEEQA